MAKVIAYKCISDCTLDYTNFEDGEIIEIPDDDFPNDWKGTDFFDNHPYEFEKVYDGYCKNGVDCSCSMDSHKTCFVPN